MKLLAGLLLLCGLAAAEPARRIENIIVRPATQEVCWTVAIGKMVDDKFVMERLSDESCIDQKESSMTVAGQKVWFFKKETENLRPLFEMLSRYVRDSTLWFEESEGFETKAERDRVESGGKPVPKMRVKR
jgi:hypothetical protein